MNLVWGADRGDLEVAQLSNGILILLNIYMPIPAGWWPNDTRQQLECGRARPLQPIAHYIPLILGGA